MCRTSRQNGATAYAVDFVFPGGAANNKIYFQKDITIAPTLSEDRQMILWDPQTSGGLLLAVPSEQLADFQSACVEREQPALAGSLAAGGLRYCPGE